MMLTAFFRVVVMALLTVTLASPWASAQDESASAYLLDNATPLTSIAGPRANQDDLNPLKSIIGDAVVIELFEHGSAGDGATYDGMVRLVTYLHREMDFEVLIWPVGIFEAHSMELALRNGKSIESSAQTLYAVWRQSRHVLPLLEYAQSSYLWPQPLLMVGTHAQYHAVAKRKYASHLTSFLNAAATMVPRQDVTLLDSLWTKPRRLRDVSDGHRQEARSAALKLQLLFRDQAFALRQRYSQSRIALESIMLENLIAFIDIESARAQESTETYESEKLRRAATQRNLSWMTAGPYRGRKFVLWGRWPEAQTIFGEEIRSIGFTAYTGKLGRPNRPERSFLPPAKDGTVEALLHRLPGPGSILNLRPARLHTPNPLASVTARISNEISPELNWTDRFDALFFIDEVYPNESIEKEE